MFAECWNVAVVYSMWPAVPVRTVLVLRRYLTALLRMVTMVKYRLMLPSGMMVGVGRHRTSHFLESLVPGPGQFVSASV